MKHLQASATRQTPAAIDDVYALLVDVDGYPRWYPDGVPSAQVTARSDDGTPTEARATLAAAVGPINRSFDVRMRVSTQAPSTVDLVRIPHDARDKERLEVHWRLTPGAGGGTTIAVALDADLSVPAFLPVGQVGDAIANGFADAAVGAVAS